MSSVWTPWELGYAHAAGKKICLLPLGEMEGAAAYLDIYSRAKIDQSEILIIENGETITIKEWIDK